MKVRCGYLIARSSYVPKWIGVLLCIDGLYWTFSGFRPYALPSVPPGIFFYFTFTELIFMLWLVFWGSRIREPVTSRPIPVSKT